MESESLNKIAERIKQRRESLGISLQYVADLTGISKSTLQRYETGGIKNIPIQRLDGLAKALKTSPEWIMGTSEDGWYSTLMEIYRDFCGKPGYEELPAPENVAITFNKGHHALPFTEDAHFEGFLTSEEILLISVYRVFTAEGRQKIREYMLDLSQSPKYFPPDKS